MKIIFFDDDCLMCNTFVKILIKLDHKNLLKFASLNSKTSQSIRINKDNPNIDSIIYKKDLKEYIYSDAIIEIISDITINVRFLKLVPKNARDLCYRLIAKYRKKIHLKTKYKTCGIPSIEYKNKFLN